MPSIKTAIGIKVREKLGIQPRCVGRKLTVFPDDVFLVSYPKSGSTWIRFLIANLLYPNTDITFTNIQNIIPDIYLTSDRQLLQLPRPRIVKSHEYFDPRYKKVILIVRNPQDITLSSYFHFLKYGLITNKTSLEEFGINFLTGKYHFVGESNLLGSWAENTGSWLGSKQEDANFLLLRYEDFQTNPVEQLSKIANFLACKSSESNINNAIKNSSIQRMRKLEQQQTNVWPTKYTKQNIAFVRSAVCGEGSDKLPQTVLDQIEHCWGQIMNQLGYLN